MFGECHAHLMMNGYDYKKAIKLHKEKVNEAHIRDAFKTYQQLGITFIRDGGDKLGVSKLAKKIAPEYGIDYRTPIFAIHKKGYYGSIVGRSFSTFDEYEKLVEEATSLGADFIKIMISGIMDFAIAGKLSCEPLCDEEIQKMIEIAHSYNLSVMAHTNGKSTVEAAVVAGVDSIEHGNFIDVHTLSLMKTSGTIYVPTISTIGNLLKSDRFPKDEVSKILDIAKSNIQTAYQLGVTTALGSDAGAYLVPHGQGIIDEYHYFKDILLSENVTEDMIDQWLSEGELKIKKLF